MRGCADEEHAPDPSMDPVDALIGQSGKYIHGTSFGGEKVNKRDLGETDPCCAERDIV